MYFFLSRVWFRTFLEWSKILLMKEHCTTNVKILFQASRVSRDTFLIETRSFKEKLLFVITDKNKIWPNDNVCFWI